MRPHPSPDQRHLADVVVVEQRLEPDARTFSSAAMAFWPSARDSVNETSVRPVEPDTFWTIMSMLTSASAIARKMPAASPGLSGTPTTVTRASDRSWATPEMIACSTSSSSGMPTTQVPSRSENDERTWTGTS
jgi:hypothetical protein